jgi:TonB family protein
MNRVPKYLFLCLLITFTCQAVTSQQGASLIDQSTSGTGSESSSRLTADGVPFCFDETKSWPLPEGVYRVGGNVLPPTPTKTPQATFSDEGRKYARSVKKAQHLKRFEVKSLVGLTVDTNGLPQNICVLNELGHGFDRRAFDAVVGWRFNPATRDNKLVPVRLTVEVAFALW